jgi:3D (Asp-Asp-Asp) domain-containing protein
MKNYLKSSKIKKIIIAGAIFSIILGISVFAGNVKLNSVNIKFSNNQEITVLTAKTKISDILQENHIVIEDNETVTPGIDSEITNTKTIVISLKGEEPIKIAQNTTTEINKEQVLEEYTNLTEKIETVIEEIPFETVTKDVSNGATTTRNAVIQSGKNGEKKVTYKVTYKENEELSREKLSEEIIKNPVDKIVQVQSKSVITSRSSFSRVTGTSGKSGVYKVTAYCACMQCCGKTNGITASGAKATANHTIAAPRTFAFGTKVVINGTTYVVEDRGGAIQGNRIDIYMNSHAEALRWGVRYVEVEVLD